MLVRREFVWHQVENRWRQSCSLHMKEYCIARRRKTGRVSPKPPRVATAADKEFVVLLAGFNIYHRESNEMPAVMKRSCSPEQLVQRMLLQVRSALYPVLPGGCPARMAASVRGRAKSGMREQHAGPALARGSASAHGTHRRRTADEVREQGWGWARAGGWRGIGWARW